MTWLPLKQLPISKGYVEGKYGRHVRIRPRRSNLVATDWRAVYERSSENFVIHNDAIARIQDHSSDEWANEVQATVLINNVESVDEPQRVISRVYASLVRLQPLDFYQRTCGDVGKLFRTIFSPAVSLLADGELGVIAFRAVYPNELEGGMVKRTAERVDAFANYRTPLFKRRLLHDLGAPECVSGLIVVLGEHSIWVALDGIREGGMFRHELAEVFLGPLKLHPSRLEVLR